MLFETTVTTDGGLNQLNLFDLPHSSWEDRTSRELFALMGTVTLTHMCPRLTQPYSWDNHHHHHLMKLVDPVVL
jgi:hypothetical protein